MCLLPGPRMAPISPLVKPLLDKWLELTQSGFEFNEHGDDEELSRTRRRYIFSAAPAANEAMSRISLLQYNHDIVLLRVHYMYRQYRYE